MICTLARPVAETAKRPYTKSRTRPRPERSMASRGRAGAEGSATGHRRNLLQSQHQNRQHQAGDAENEVAPPGRLHPGQHESGGSERDRGEQIAGESRGLARPGAVEQPYHGDQHEHRDERRQQGGGEQVRAARRAVEGAAQQEPDRQHQRRDDGHHRQRTVHADQRTDRERTGSFRIGERQAIRMRFGLFGTGPWAQEAHAPGLAAHPDVDFAGVWGRNEAKAADLAARYGGKAYGAPDALIDDVDAVAIALPPAVQAPIALRAARAGKHLLLDKPVAFEPADAAEIAAAVAERNLASVVFFTRRFLPGLREFLADTARTGGWIEARVDHVGTIYDEGNPFGASQWRRESGGLWDVGPHATALVLPVLGPVTEVSALAGPHDMTHVLLRHASGAISTLTLSVDVPAKAAREEAMFAGEAGVVPVPVLPWEPVEAFGVAIGELLAAASGGPASELDVRFGLQVTQILAAAAESVASGRTVSVG